MLTCERIVEILAEFVLGGSCEMPPIFAASNEADARFGNSISLYEGRDGARGGPNVSDWNGEDRPNSIVRKARTSVALAPAFRAVNFLVCLVFAPSRPSDMVRVDTRRISAGMCRLMVRTRGLAVR